MSLSEDLVKTVRDLHQLEINLNHTYRHTVDHVQSEDIKKKLKTYKAEHTQHLIDLEKILKKNGFSIPSRSRNIAGWLKEVFTSLRSIFSDEQALKAMKNNEEDTIKSYTKALRKILSHDLELNTLLQKNLRQENQHYNFTVDRLKKKEGHQK